LAVIAANSILLGLADYSHVDQHGELISEGSWRNSLISQSEIIFTSIFTIEFVFKIIGLGVKDYARDAWNWLDFAVVLTG
jgi:hypothetical protein